MGNDEEKFRKEMRDVVSKMSNAALAGLTGYFLRELVDRGVVEINDAAPILLVALVQTVGAKAKREQLKKDITGEPRIVLPKDRQTPAS